MDQESRNREHNESTQRGDLARSLLSRGRWARSVLSPWVRRSLPTRAGVGSVRRRRVAFSEGHTCALVERVQRRAESSRVWHPDAGSVASATWRLADGIVGRYQPVADKYRVQFLEESAEPEAELPLAPGGLFPGLGGLSPQPHRAPLTPPPLPVSSVPAAEPPSAMPRASSRLASASRQPARAEPRRGAVRAFSRVEEITPASVPPAETVAPERPQEEQAVVVEGEAVPPVEPDKVSDAPPRVLVHEARPPTEAAPSSPPTIQRPGDRETPARRPPRAELPLAGKPEIPEQRLPDEPLFSPAVAQEETPLSALPQEGEPPSAAPTVQRRGEGEMAPSLPAEREMAAAWPETPVEPSWPAEPPPPRLDQEMSLPALPSVEARPVRAPVRREAVPVQPEAPMDPGQPVERQLEQDMPLPAPPSIEAGPPRPPVSPEVTPAQPKTLVTPDQPAELLAVERQLDQEMPLPAPPPIEARPSRPPISREVATVQPKVLPGVGPEPSRPAEAPSPPPVVQRRADLERPVSGLEEKVLARAAQRARLSLTEAAQLTDRLPPAQKRVRTPEADVRLELPLVPPARPPGQTTVLRALQPPAQARLEDQEAAARGVVPGWSRTWEEALPLPPVSRPASVERVQRQVVDAPPELAMPPGEAGILQRVTETAPEGDEAPAGGGELDLNRLARQVYPFIKRMLAVERERRLSR